MRDYDEGGTGRGEFSVKTPIADFVRRYAAATPVRLHMPGHKGKGPLGCEQWDITEIPGTDTLYEYEADGIIAQSEKNAAALFGAAGTFYSTEGSSHCIRAMLTLAVWNFVEKYPGVRPAVIAGRNIHKSFLYAAALLDFDIIWLWPEKPKSICACSISPEQLESAISALAYPAAAVYITSPDYLGGMSSLERLAAVAHAADIPFLVDNAHGAYLHFVSPACHPLDVGADLCCDSAHKTLPVLTGGAWMHTGCSAPDSFLENGNRALAMTGSTSPSWLVLQSLDLCNQLLAEEYPARLQKTAGELETLRQQLRSAGWVVADTDPLKLTIDCAASGWNGYSLDQRLRSDGIFCEYCDMDDLVCMFTPENSAEDFRRLKVVLGYNTLASRQRTALPRSSSEGVLSVRDALWLPHETVSAALSVGRICGAPLVSCPPAIPVAVAGERITTEMQQLFEIYKIKAVDVLKLPEDGI